MLKKNGRAAVIIPEGVLFNSGKAYKTVREILLKDCDLEAVISLPSGVFYPYTGVKTSILLFTKKQFESDKYHTKKVWFYGMDSDGYTLDNSRKKVRNDFPLREVINQFETRNYKNNPQKDRSQKYFYVDLKVIIENKFDLTYNRYLEIKYVPKNYDPPKDILAKIIELEENVFKNLSDLNKIIK